MNQDEIIQEETRQDEIRQEETKQAEMKQEQEGGQKREQNVRIQKQPTRFGLGALAIPLVIYFLISMIVEVILGIFLLQDVMMKYLSESPEFMAMLNGFTDSTPFNEMMDSMNQFMTDAIVLEIMEQVSLRMGEFVTYTTVVSGFLSIPVFFLLMKRDQKKFLPVIEGAKVIRIVKKVEIWKYSIIVIGSGAICVALNNFIKLMNLASYSEAYQVVEGKLYSIPLWLQLIGLCMVVPIAEELLFRGVLYQRIKFMASSKMAMVWSALLFALFHGNLVQAGYGFICGLILVWVYEVYGSLKAPILVHMCMNLVSVILTQYNVFYWMFEEPLRVGVITVVSATLASVCYVLIKEWVIDDIKVVIKN